jgi:hypothetical protein
MKLAGHPLTRAVTALSLALIAALTVLFGVQSVAVAEPVLSLAAEKGLSSVEESEAILVQGSPGLLPSSWPTGAAEAEDRVRAQIVLEFSGPVDIGQVGKERLDIGVAGRMTYAVPVGDVGADGSFSSRIVVLSSALLRPGAYRTTVTLTTGGVSLGIAIRHVVQLGQQDGLYAESESPVWEHLVQRHKRAYRSCPAEDASRSLLQHIVEEDPIGIAMNTQAERPDKCEVHLALRSGHPVAG